MLSIFKKKEERNYVEEYTEKLQHLNAFTPEPEPIITSKDIQQDLHKSFEEVLAEFDLKESKETQIENNRQKLEVFKQENKAIYDKVEILKNLNLSATPSVSKSLEKLKDKEQKINLEINKIQSEINKVQRLKDLTLEYSLKYPCYKFIDEETMVKIMHKYDLVLGEAFMYSREIPDENLEVINYFAKEIKESESVKQLMATYYGSLVNYRFRDKLEPKFIDYGMGIYIEDPSNYDFRERVEKEFIISSFKMIAPESHFTIPHFEMRDYRSERVYVPIAKLNTKTRKFEFNTDKVNEVEQKRREVLDPIGALEVDGGYIIMSYWDECAEIPEIKTNMLN